MEGAFGAEQPTLSNQVTISRDRQEKIDIAAAAWTARLGDGPLSVLERRDLSRWLTEDPAHEAAFAQAQSVWTSMGALSPNALAESPDIVAPHRPADDTAPAHADRRRWGPIAAVAACLALLFVATGAWLGEPVLLMTADYRTLPGEQRSITLSDGSEVSLGPDSAIAVAYSGRERRVDLLAGIAHFKAAPLDADEPRPFAVAASGGTARALGTEFIVERLAADVRVTVVEHRVAVALDRGTEGSAEVTLGSGQAVQYSHDHVGQARKIDLARALAWQRGRLIFDDVALSDVVTALSRYGTNRIVIVDPDLAARKVSGIFETDQADAALATVTRDLGVSTATVPGFFTLLY